MAIKEIPIQSCKRTSVIANSLLRIVFTTLAILGHAGNVCTAGSDDLAPALLRAILHVFPVLGPLLAPLESSTAAHTDPRLKAVFGLWGWTHGSSLMKPQ